MKEFKTNSIVANNLAESANGMGLTPTVARESTLYLSAIVNFEEFYSLVLSYLSCCCFLVQLLFLQYVTDSVLLSFFILSELSLMSFEMSTS